MSNISFARLLILSACLIVLGGCCHHTVYEGVLAVREECCRIQKALPLTDTDIDSILVFIWRDGRMEDAGFSSLPDTAAFRPILNLLRDSANCKKQTFVGSVAFDEWIDPVEPRVDVFDSRQAEGPDVGGGRHAFLHKKGFWLILYVENSARGFSQKIYDTIIVQKDFEVTGSK